MQKIYGKFRKIMVGGKKQEPKNTEMEMQPGNPRPTFLPTQVGLGITQAVHCEVIHVSFCTVQCVISTSILINLANPVISPPFITRNHSNNNVLLSVRFRMMTVPSIDDLRSWDCLESLDTGSQPFSSKRLNIPLM